MYSAAPGRNFHFVIFTECAFGASGTQTFACIDFIYSPLQNQRERSDAHIKTIVNVKNIQVIPTLMYIFAKTIDYNRKYHQK